MQNTKLPSGVENRNGALIPGQFSKLPEGWQTEWETFSSADHKLQLFGSWFHENNLAQSPKGHKAILVLHGIGEHGGRYQSFAADVSGVVGSVYALDHRGHGRSEGVRGHLDRFDQYLEDVELALDRLAERIEKQTGKSAEIHLVGHSMGGLIALGAAIERPSVAKKIRSVILSAPFLGLKLAVPPVKKAASILLSRVWADLQFKNEIDAGDLSHVPELVESYKHDRLNHPMITSGLFSELQAALKRFKEGQNETSLPVLMLIAGEDRLVDSQAAQQYFERLKSPKKALKKFEGFYHEILNEERREEVYLEIGTWVRSFD